MTRRAAVCGALAAPFVASAVVARSSAEPPIPTLQEIAGDAGMLFGSAASADPLARDSTYRTALARQCGILTPEFQLNWNIVEPARGRLDFTGADAIASFAKATSKTIHGHSLIWHLGIPGWGADALAEQPDWGLVRRFMASVVPRYADVAGSWDVVNEAIEPLDGRSDGLRASPYLKAFGADYVRRAFEDAHTLAPKALLFLNEYGLEYDFPEEAQRRSALLRLLESLRRSGAPIAGLGVQGHLDLAKQDRFNGRVVADFLNEVGSLGLQVRISEFDVKEADVTLPIPRRDQLVADAAERFLDVALANRAVGSVTSWGISNRYSWLNQPNLINRGLPLDSDFAPSPLYGVLARAFAGRAVGHKR